MKNQNNKLELNKLSGFDILEKLPEDQMLRSYNEEFYTSLNNVKIISLPVERDFDYDRLFYHFEQNDNASVSTNTYQLLVNKFF
jgi:hypothetical protein